VPRDEKFTRERTAARRLAAEYFERFPKQRYQTAGRELARTAIGKHRVHHEAAARADREGDGDLQVSNDIERELAKILARDNELRDAEASEKESKRPRLRQL
jgi:hypothetical protein